MLGLRGTEAEQAALGRFQESPGQSFLRERGERALLRSQAAIGGLGGGNVRSALVEQGIGFAGQFLGERQDRLAGVAGRGLTATTSGAGLGLQAETNISDLLVGRGEARASGILGQAAGARRGIGQVAKAFI